ncbi:MAG TPA: NAD(+)/NADH kinase [Bacteroidales bacterium]|nr:NAD(+)/NADH kinase [Bacteroidales bacterium]
MLKRIAIFGSDNGSSTTNCLNDLFSVLESHELEILVHENLVKNLDINEYKVFHNLYAEGIRPDLVLSVGGDGTFLESVLQVRDSGVPIAGVNAGRMGFLANIHDDIEGSLEKIINLEYTIINRHLIELVKPFGAMGRSNVALNDITIQKADLNMVMVKVFVDDLYLNTYWSDGLIISTATGSTAYNMSTGGPILSPADDSIIISPLSPHTLSVRPIVLPGSSRLRLEVEGRSPEFLVTCDFRSVRMPFFRQLEISQTPYTIKTINVRDQDFFSTLRNKLMWGADTRN